MDVTGTGFLFLNTMSAQMGVIDWHSRFVGVSVSPTVLSGAISAILGSILGALGSYLVFVYRTRRRIKKAISTELEINHEILTNMIEHVEKPEWNGVLFGTFHMEAFNAAKLQDPDLLMRYGEGDADLLRVYQRLEVIEGHCSEDRVGEPGSSLLKRGEHRDEILDLLYETHEELDNALNVIQFGVTSEEIHEGSEGEDEGSQSFTKRLRSHVGRRRQR